MYYSADLKQETQSSRFGRWRIDYDHLFRVIEAKERRISFPGSKKSKTLLVKTIR